MTDLEREKYGCYNMTFEGMKLGNSSSLQWVFQASIMSHLSNIFLGYLIPIFISFIIFQL
jgi:hypothetical protein